MITVQMNKFNVIHTLTMDEINYSSILKNYLENYFESNINIYHPDYIYQLIWNKKVSLDEINQLFNDAVSNMLIQKRQIIRSLIKKDKFDLGSLNQLISNFNSKVVKLENILSLKNSNISNNVRSILSDPVLINYLESEFENLDNETVGNIQKLTDILSKCSVEDYNWFLKLVGSVLRNTIVPLSVNMPEKYKYFYELNNIIEYTYQVTKMYKFLGESILILLNPIYEIILSKFITCINNCDILELLNLINNKIYIIKKLFKDNEKKLIITAVSNNFNNHILNIESFDYDKILYLLKLIIKCKDLDILESYILLVFENEKVMDSILDIIHEKINDEPVCIKNIISLLKIKNKDEFMCKYHNLLIQRILSNETNINDEKMIIYELIGTFGPKVTNKSLKVINDFIKSEDDLKIYKQKTNIEIFNTLTTSYSNWDINYNQGYVTFNMTDEYEIIKDISTNKKTDISTKIVNKIKKLIVCNNKVENKLVDIETYIINYQKYYSSIYEEKRKLLWLLQYGEVEITYMNINIKLLPIQLLILELYNVKYAFSFDEIYNQSFFINYSNKFKEDIVNSLISGNILFQDGNKLYLNENNVSNISSNLIEVYLHNTIMNEIKPSQIDTQNELSHDREDIVKTLINHNLKLNSIDKDILFSKLENSISVFKLTPDIYNNAVNKMIKYDYITMENNILVKCIY